MFEATIATNDGEIIPVEDLAEVAAPALASETDILGKFEQRLRDCSFAGDTANAKLMYLALTTRLFRSIVSAILKGHSGIGKSHLMETVAAFFPPEAYIKMTGGSEKSFIYEDEDYRHRFLIIAEAAGIGGPNGNIWLRSLLSEGRIDYRVTERRGDNKFESRRVSKEGPTGILTTTTAINIHNEDESRLLSIPVDDSAEQIRAILLSTARRTIEDDEPSYDDWFALHRWIASRPLDVSIPFAEKLAGLVDCDHPRITRAFKHMLSLVKAHALLHQANRETNDEGVVATLDDYEAIRALVEPLIADSVSSTVPRQVREIVEMVRELSRVQEDILDRPNGEKEGVAGYRLAKALTVNASTVSRRVNQAISLGFLINLEERPNQRQRLVLGDPMPDDRTVFPLAEVLVT